MTVIVNIFVAFYIYESFGRAESKVENLIDINKPDLGYIWKLQSPSESPMGWTGTPFTLFLFCQAH